MRHKHEFMSLNRIGQTPVKTRTHRFLVFAKLRDDRLLALLNNKESGSKPYQQHHAGDKAKSDAGIFHVRLKAAAATATAATPGKQAAQFAVEVTPQIIQVWRLSACSGVPWARVWPLLLRRVIRRVASAVVVTATTPSGIVQIENAKQARIPRRRTPRR